MNLDQQNLYFYVWGECRKALAKHGRPHDDAARKALQKDALGGTVKSSKSLTNAELTKVLAKFRTWSEPGNFAAQMHAQEEPEKRLATLRDRVLQLASDCGINDGARGVENYFWKWLNNRKLPQLDADTLRKLAFILERRKAQLPAAKTADERAPF